MRNESRYVQRRMYSVIVVLITFIGIICAGCTAGGNQQDVGLSVSPQNIMVFSAAGEGGSDLYLLDLASKKVSRFTNSPDYEETPSFSRDGKQIAYSAAQKVGEGGHIFVLPLSGGKPRQLTTGNSTYDWCPRFSSDGNKIVFARAALHRPYSMGGWTWDDWDIYTIDVTGKNLKRITNKKYYQADNPCFCEGDKKIVFSGDPGGEGSDYSIWTVDNSASPKEPRVLFKGFSSSCSHDGKQITFVADVRVSYEYEVQTMGYDGKRRAQLTHNTSYNMSPVFTSDGKHILFLSDLARDERFELWQVDSDGKNLKQIADSSLFDDPMKWKP